MTPHDPAPPSPLSRDDAARIRKAIDSAHPDAQRRVDAAIARALDMDGASPLEALLKEVEARAARGGDILSVLGYTEGAKAQTCEQRLAAIVRVLRDAMTEADVDLDPRYPLPRKARKRLDTALRRADEIAGGPVN